MLIPKDYRDIMHQVFDQSTQGFQVIGKDWTYLYVNKAVSKQGKKSVNELIGKKMMEVYPGIENTQMFEHLKKVMHEKVSVKMDNEFSYPDGSMGWFSLFIHPWSDGIIIFSVDITDRKNEEIRLLGKIADLGGEAFGDQEILKELEDIKKAIEKLTQPVVKTI